MPSEEELKAAELQLVTGIAKGLFFLDGPLFPSAKWDYAHPRTKELYLAKARFVISYVKEEVKQ